MKAIPYGNDCYPVKLEFQKNSSIFSKQALGYSNSYFELVPKSPH